MKGIAENKITKETLIPVGVAIGVSFVIVTGAWTAASAVTRMEARIQRLNEKVEVNEKRLEQLERRPFWMREDHRQWTEMLRALNLELRVPPEPPR